MAGGDGGIKESYWGREKREGGAAGMVGESLSTRLGRDEAFETGEDSQRVGAGTCGHIIILSDTACLRPR